MRNVVKTEICSNHLIAFHNKTDDDNDENRVDIEIFFFFMMNVANRSIRIESLRELEKW